MRLHLPTIMDDIATDAPESCQLLLYAGEAMTQMEGFRKKRDLPVAVVLLSLAVAARWNNGSIASW